MKNHALQKNSEILKQEHAILAITLVENVQDQTVINVPVVKLQDIS